jgi:nucleotidyltransferase/DNA polymerase involved in DNA repair
MDEADELSEFLMGLTKITRFPIVGALTGSLNRRLFKVASEAGLIETLRVGPNSMTVLTAAGFERIGRRHHDYSQV